MSASAKSRGKSTQLGAQVHVDVAREVQLAMAKDTVQRVMVELGIKLVTMAQDLRKKPEARIEFEPALALEKVHLAAQAVLQQARATFFLDVLDCKPEDATACLGDLETKCVIYHSWAKPLLACISPAARKVATGPCAQVLLLTQALLSKAASPGEEMRPADLGHFEAAVNELPKLPVRGTDPDPKPNPKPQLPVRGTTLTLTLTLALSLSLTRYAARTRRAASCCAARS